MEAISDARDTRSGRTWKEVTEGESDEEVGEEFEILVDWNENVQVAKRLVNLSKKATEHAPSKPQGFRRTGVGGAKSVTGIVDHQIGHNTKCRNRIMELMKEARLGGQTPSGVFGVDEKARQRQKRSLRQRMTTVCRRRLPLEGAVCTSTSSNSTPVTSSAATSMQPTSASKVDETCSSSHVDPRYPLDVDDKKEK